MTKSISLPEPRVPWARHKTAKKPSQPIPLLEIMTAEQFLKYQNASEKQRKWAEEFLHTGDSDLAARIAYPKATVGSVYQLSLRARKHFGLTKKDLEKFIDENPTFNSMAI